MHIPPHDNHNKPIINVDDVRVPLNYFNVVKLVQGQSFEYHVPGYETGIVPATGTIDVNVEGENFTMIGQRGVDVWDGEPEGVYAPSGTKVRLVCTSAQAEVFVAGARFDGELTPFSVRAVDIDKKSVAIQCQVAGIDNARAGSSIIGAGTKLKIVGDCAH